MKSLNSVIFQGVQALMFLGLIAGAVRAHAGEPLMEPAFACANTRGEVLTVNMTESGLSRMVFEARGKRWEVAAIHCVTAPSDIWVMRCRSLPHERTRLAQQWLASRHVESTALDWSDQPESTDSLLFDINLPESFGYVMHKAVFQTSECAAS